MLQLTANLKVARCPYCGIAKPLLVRQHTLATTGERGRRFWAVYICTVCGGVVVAASEAEQGLVTEHYPYHGTLSESIPERPREFLRQARESLGQPVGAIMLCASAVDAMLKDKKLKDGDLYDRINKAATSHIITEDMAKWAHQVRLDANDQRHADEGAALPTQQDAARSVGFAVALADILYVIPDRVTRGIEESKVKPKPKPKE